MSDADLSRFAKFATAGLAGIAGWIVVHPFNTLAVRMNLANYTKAVGAGQSFAEFAKTIVGNEGIGALYKGLSAGITRQIFYATSRFGLFEVYRDLWAKYREMDLLGRLVVGVLSGATAAYISCPAEVTLVRMSNDAALPVGQRRNYKSLVDAATRIATEEGVATFWRGSMPFVNRAMVVGALQVGTYDQFKITFKNWGVTGAFANVFCAAMSSGFIYSLATMPLESAKNRMAFQKPENGVLPYRSTLQTVASVTRAEGVLSLWNGFLPYYGRCGGHTVAMFVALEQIRKTWLKTFGANK